MPTPAEIADEQKVPAPYYCGRPDGLGSRLLNFLQARIRARELCRPLKCLWQPLPKVHQCGGSFIDVFSDHHHDEFIGLNGGFGTWLRAAGFDPDTFSLDRAIRQGEVRGDPSYRSALRREFLSLRLAHELAEPIAAIRGQMAVHSVERLSGVHVRAGDVCDNISFWFPSRFLPFSFYEEFFSQHLPPLTSHVLLCSNNLELVSKLPIQAELMTVGGMIDIDGFSPIQQAFLEMVALSCCHTVYGPRASAFSMMATVIGQASHSDIAAIVLGRSGLRLVESLINNVHHQHNQNLLRLLDHAMAAMDPPAFEALLEYAMEPLPRSDQLYRDLQAQRNLS